MNKIITTTEPKLASVSTTFTTALAPLKFRQLWQQPLVLAHQYCAWAFDVDPVFYDWQDVQENAVAIQQKFPPLAEINAARRAVDDSLQIKPAPSDYHMLTGRMIETLSIRNDGGLSSYVEMLAMELAADNHDLTDPDLPAWMPVGGPKERRPSRRLESRGEPGSTVCCLIPRRTKSPQRGRRLAPRNVTKLRYKFRARSTSVPGAKATLLQHALV